MKVLRWLSIRRVRILAVAALGLLAVAALTIGTLHRRRVQPFPFDTMSTAEAAESQRRQHAIDREIARIPSREWAGIYSGEAAGHFKMMWLAPQTGFVFYGCGGNGVCDHNYGDIIDTPGGLRFRFALVNRRDGPVGFAPMLIPVRWGRHRFLIPPADMIRFCNDVNSGRVNPDNYIERSERGSSQSCSGLPEVPRVYQKYLLTHSIHTRILSVLSSRKCLEAAMSESAFLGACDANRLPSPWALVSSVTLDAGASDGVFPGMVLWKSDSGTWATVSAVTAAHRCRAKIRQDFEDDHLPQPGWQFASHSH